MWAPVALWANVPGRCEGTRWRANLVNEGALKELTDHEPMSAAATACSMRDGGFFTTTYWDELGKNPQGAKKLATSSKKLSGGRPLRAGLVRYYPEKDADGVVRWGSPTEDGAAVPEDCLVNYWRRGPVDAPAEYTDWAPPAVWRP